ncbi:MAG TPA: glycosyltransferase [Frateuria sp.]|uniref:glycosyltransferase n=1 Tax=Frateuria sp. TaxID=2211372 RepID=UPI002DF6201E|nr:glycosyltransferase [Frateuria sp.]
MPHSLPYRVLLVLPDAAAGGGHLMNMRLADQLTRRGWVVDIALLFDRNEHSDYRENFSRLRFISLHADRRLKRVLLPLRLARLAREYHLVLAGLDLAATNYGYLAARIAKRPFVSWMHIAFDEHSQFVPQFSRKLSLWIYRRLTHIVFPSRGARDSLERALDGQPPSAQWHIIDNFHEVGRSAAVTATPPAHVFSQPVVLSIGRLSAQKAYDRLIRIHASLRNKGAPHHLVILGEGPERVRLQALAAALRVSDSIFLPGHVSNPQPWLSAATVFALCSLYEGLPLVLIEALQAGLPVAAMACPAGPREILDDGETGILVPADDETALESAITRLLTNPALRATYAERGKRKADAYSPETIVPQWESLLGNLIRNTSAHEVVTSP